MFRPLVGREPVIIGWPTLLEARMVLTGKGFVSAAKMIGRLAETPNVTTVAFDEKHYVAPKMRSSDLAAVVIPPRSTWATAFPMLWQQSPRRHCCSRAGLRANGSETSSRVVDGMTGHGQNPVDRRALTLDTIAAVLPIDRRDKLAELLTDQDIETLRHLVNEGMGENTLRALTSDLAYLQAWCLAATGHPLPWPAPEALLLKFVAHHLWNPEQRLKDPEHGMPSVIGGLLRDKGLLRVDGPHAPDTVRRRLASWSTLTRWRGVTGAFASPALRQAIRLAVRATPRPRKRKSAKAVTGDVLAQLLATCGGGTLRDLRDRAILMVAFASGGRRRSEVAALRIDQLTVEPPIEREMALPCPRCRFTSAAQRRPAPITTRWSTSPVGRWRRSRLGSRRRRSAMAVCSARSIGGAMSRTAPLMRNRSTRWSSSGRDRPVSTPESFPPMGCARAI